MQVQAPGQVRGPELARGPEPGLERVRVRVPEPEPEPHHHHLAQVPELAPRRRLWAPELPRRREPPR